MIKLNTIIQELSAGGSISSIPELTELKTCFENNEWHHETTFEHTMDVLMEYENFLAECSVSKFDGYLKIATYLNEVIGQHRKAELFKLVIFFHDLGKASTIVKEGEITKFPNHEERSYEIAKEVVTRFDLSASEAEYVVKLVQNHGLPHMAFDNEQGVQAGFAEINKKQPAIYIDLLLLGMLDTRGAKLKVNNPEKFAFRMQAYAAALGLH